MNPILSTLHSEEKKLAVLIDPDQHKLRHLPVLLKAIHEYHVPIIFLGGSFLSDDQMENCIHKIRKHCPEGHLVLFPGSTFQLHKEADAVLFLSLLSGRNPDYLIGRQVIAAPYIKKLGLPTISTGYIMIDGGKMTAAHYVSQSMPIPYEQDSIAAATALAGQMLGMQSIYMDAGSGATHAIRPEMIRAVREEVNIPLIVGGGIRTAEQCYLSASAGADVVVVGNAFEEQPELIGAFQLSLKEATQNVSKE